VLWTRQAVQQLIAERFGIEVSVWTMGRYLKCQLPLKIDPLSFTEN
jgi:hypothetical protein